MLAAFSVTPLGAGDSVGELVADAVRIVRESGLANETNAMFTNIEGEWDEVMAVIHRCVDAVAARSPRVSIVIKIDHRPTRALVADEVRRLGQAIQVALREMHSVLPFVAVAGSSAAQLPLDRLDLAVQRARDARAVVDLDHDAHSG